MALMLSMKDAKLFCSGSGAGSGSGSGAGSGSGSGSGSGLAAGFFLAVH
ncbi:hypothetical protein TeGR_g9456, partial [Tetraparma gracilis]